jgi:hypothetical protein
MNSNIMRFVSYLALALLLSSLLTACLPQSRVAQEGRAYGYDVLRQEGRFLLDKGRWSLQAIFEPRLSEAEAVALVEDYFTLSRQVQRLRRQVRTWHGPGPDTVEILRAQLEWAQAQRSLLRNRVQDILARQVGQALREAGLVVSLGPGGPAWLFPPQAFVLGRMPYLLVTSPRQRIEIAETAFLDPELGLSTIEAIESRVEATGVSALAERIGGLGLYPAWVPEDASLRPALRTIAHEWVHGYLFLFFPVGRAYFRDYQMRTINETVADIIGNEIGDQVYQRYYAGGEGGGRESPSGGTSFDFSQEMRRIRQRVDQLLAQGQVAEAETYMEQRRQFLISQGYYLRRLNQAYFALHGTYADVPGFESPIGKALKTLRAQSPSLAEFVRVVGSITSYEDLRNRLAEGGVELVR